jgi:hypothetical protein
LAARRRDIEGPAVFDPVILEHRARWQQAQGASEER